MVYLCGDMGSVISNEKESLCESEIIAVAVSSTTASDGINFTG
jgi:hypothetical protein